MLLFNFCFVQCTAGMFNLLTYISNFCFEIINGLTQFTAGCKPGFQLLAQIIRIIFLNIFCKPLLFFIKTAVPLL